MRGNVEAIKERLDIAEVVSSYVKLEKSGVNFKGKCPFHQEKTASFFVSTSRQNYYCFGCGEKGDIFTIVEKLEGVDFKEALKLLAERAGVELKYERVDAALKGEKDKLLEVLELATEFFEQGLKNNAEAKKYLLGRGLSEDSIKRFRLGFTKDEWRELYEHLKTLGYEDPLLLKAGLIKKPEGSEKNPYDVFRGRLIFPMFDQSGKVIAYSGRALAPDAIPKYLNSPDTLLFNKSEVLYGLDKAKDEIRKKNYAVLVEGQMDLVLSHQVGVPNTVASSGTAFTERHLERLKGLSKRIILAFDGDAAGVKAAEKSALLALALGLEVKVATLPEGRDPADMIKEDPEKWKNVLRESKHAIEVFLERILKGEKDKRKSGQQILKKILPLVTLLQSAIERGHFVSLISRKTGLSEALVWEDLKNTKMPEVAAKETKAEDSPWESESKGESSAKISREEELANVLVWLKEEPNNKNLLSHRAELEKFIAIDALRGKIEELRQESPEDEEKVAEIISLQKELDELRRKVV